MVWTDFKYLEQSQNSKCAVYSEHAQKIRYQSDTLFQVIFLLKWQALLLSRDINQFLHRVSQGRSSRVNEQYGILNQGKNPTTKNHRWQRPFELLLRLIGDKDWRKKPRLFVESRLGIKLWSAYPCTHDTSTFKECTFFDVQLHGLNIAFDTGSWTQYKQIFNH